MGGLVLCSERNVGSVKEMNYFNKVLGEERRQAAKLLMWHYRSELSGWAAEGDPVFKESNKPKLITMKPIETQQRKYFTCKNVIFLKNHHSF